MLAILQGVPAPPVPPTPPMPPFPEVVVHTGWSPEMLPPPAIFLIIMAMILVSGAVLWPLMRAIGRRIENSGGNQAELARELDDLRLRVAELEERQGGLAELEDRLDFAERLLAQQRQVPEFPARGAP